MKIDFQFNGSYCKSCGICVELCPRDALAFDENQKVIMPDAEKCIGCMLCEYRCPDFAIRIVREV